MIDVKVLRGSVVRGANGKKGRIESVTFPWVRIQWEGGKIDEVDSQAYRRGGQEVSEDFEVLTLDKGWQPLALLCGTKSRQSQLISDLRTIVGEETASTESTEKIAPKTEEAAPAVEAAAAPAQDVVEEAKLVVRKRVGEKVERIEVKSAEQLHALFEELNTTEGMEISFDPKYVEAISHVFGGLVEYVNRDGEPLTEAEVLAEAPKHNPFKKWKKIGTGPLSGDNDEGKKWRCKCSNYTCKCVGLGDNSGTRKIVRINRAYKRRYNAMYKPWRTDKEPYKPSRA